MVKKGILLLVYTLMWERKVHYVFIYYMYAFVCTYYTYTNMHLQKCVQKYRYSGIKITHGHELNNISIRQRIMEIFQDALLKIAR